MSRHLLRFDRRTVQITLQADGARISLADGICRETPGAPAIPGRMIQIALPAGHRASRVTAQVLSREVLLDGPVHVAPQPAAGISALAMEAPAAPRRRALLPDPALYASVAAAPVAEFRGMNMMGSVPVASVFVRPIRVAEGGALELITALELSFTTVEDPRLVNRRTLAGSPRAIRYQDIAASLVLNPEAVSLPTSHPSGTSGIGGTTGGMPAGAGSGGSLPGLAAVPATAGPKEVDYLIITDNHSWDTNSFTPGPVIGDLVSAFAPLVAHKSGRGLRSHIVTVEAIVRGDYGDHRTGARDVPEVIRRFLQAYTYSRGVEWVLIGGDVNVVPIRRVCGSCAHGVFGAATGAAGPKVPKVGEYTWKDTYLALRLADDVATNAGQIGQPDHILTMLKSGKKVPKVAAPTGNELCWFYTDATWTNASVTPTPYVRVNGPATTINDEPQWYTNDNLIPSDLYYSSLYGPQDLQPGKHDWDQHDQGLYGQWSWDTNLGGIDFTPDISVGRAPAGSAAEASNFVSKLIAYETADSRPAEYDRFRRMLFVAEHWDHAASQVGRNATDKMPPDPWTYTYSYDAPNQRSLVRAEGLKEGALPQLLAYLPGNIRRVIPYDHDGAPRGWHYAKSGTDLSPSTTRFYIPGLFDITLPVQTEFVVVRSNDLAELTPNTYFFDPNTLDGSIVDTEKIRAYMQSAHPRINLMQRVYSDEEDLDAAGLGAAPVTHYTAAAVATAMQTGPHFVALSGHGNWPGCCSVDPTLAMGLTTGNRTSIIFADSCLTAQLEVEDSLGEVIVTRAPSGSVAYIGYTRWGWIGTGTEFQQDFFKQLWAQRHLGLMVDATRRKWVNGRYGRWHALSTTLLGCPEMPVFRDDNDAKPGFVGNAGSKELHERFCPWVRRMSVRNMRNFSDKMTALAAGYDGCGFCMREHHHR